MKNTYFVYANSNPLSQEIKEKILVSLKDEYVLDEENPSLVISVGGDGTFLRAVRKYIDKLDNIVFTGIKTGKLGFLCDFSSDEYQTFISLLKDGKCDISSHRLVSIKSPYFSSYFVNEARVEKIFDTLTCDLYINDEKIETFRGNGFNIATSLGSTAYNRSLGGPLIHPDIEGLILGEIAPINHNVYGSITSFVLLRKDDKITLKGNFKGTFIGGDTVYQTINDDINSEIVITLSDKKVQFAHFKEMRYYDKLKMSYVKGSK